MKRVLRVFAVLGVVALFGLPNVVFAQYSSGEYELNEAFFGTGGELNACSSGDTGYCSQQSTGELAVGEASSPNYGMQAGFNTTDEPLLEVAVPDNVIDLGELSLNESQSDTATFQVRTYLANGYTVYLVGSAPKISAHTLAGMGDVLDGPALAEAGIEQFGISLADVPPVQVPDTGFSFGAAVSPYDEPAAYAWLSAADETRPIAASTKSSGQTNYTITALANISGVTPAGVYTSKWSVVAVPEF